MNQAITTILFFRTKASSKGGGGRIDATQESLLMQGGLCILQAQSDCTELISRTLPLEAAD